MMVDESITFSIDGETMPLQTAPFTKDELDEIIEHDDGKFRGVFRTPLIKFMNCDAGEASYMIHTSVMEGSSFNLGYEIWEWDYEVVGFEPGNVLHVYIEGEVVIVDVED